MLKDILDMDKKAREQIQEIEEYRRSAIAGLSAKKEAINKEETEKARESAIRHSNKRKAMGEDNLAKVRESDKKVLDNMNSLRVSEMDKWVDSIVSEALKVN